jgi:hypothetical protein
MEALHKLAYHLGPHLVLNDTEIQPSMRANPANLLGFCIPGISKVGLL